MNDEKMVAALVFAQLQDPRDTLDQRARAAIFAAGVFETEWERHASARSVAADARYEARLAETRMRKEMEKLQQAEKDANDSRIISEAVKAALAAVAAQKAAE